MQFSLKVIHNALKRVADVMFQMYNLCTDTLCVLLEIVLAIV
jgi:hypothetical protein